MYAKVFSIGVDGTYSSSVTGVVEMGIAARDAHGDDADGDADEDDEDDDDGVVSAEDE